MLRDATAYSGIAVIDMTQARQFYSDTLGLRTSEEYGLMWLHHPGGRDTLIYEQPEATAASYTVLNFEVQDIDEAVAFLRSRNVTPEVYAGLNQDESGVFRDEGPYIVWFRDPSGNVLSMLQER
ncbi:VOC family protein [Arthrobacter sp. Br18]|uniref:VOC family protein n=1 Tax=Arthrobacter sp. Br18 TaxID=1312954 RepID=UPI00047A75AA|nr:VOC family protein [Arthrobacter sp. Br18]